MQLVGIATAKKKSLRNSWWKILSPNKYEGYIMTLGVDPIFRRGGLGTLLLQKITLILLENNCFNITLHVQAINQAAVNFYLKNGFLLQEKLENHYYINNVYYDAFRMELLPQKQRTVSVWESLFGWVEVYLLPPIRNIFFRPSPIVHAV
eukprot:TRINITY_DN3612_c0_g1_i1.p1 TRINITY_DN3612_c0_g1~~TRINITY_DN3612_c0_g1_i1.p1  ORF type:complete len:150 (+),score=25.62 TRINITY_DN3612_c0_g1_i1:174-623(+)